MEGLERSSLYRQAAEASEVRWLTTRKGSKVPLVWLRREKVSPPREGASQPADAQQPLVLLHCHGNATDIGMMMGPYFELAKVLGVEVAGVEYSGYGVATGKPSSSNTYADVEAAYEFLLSQGIPSKRIVVYGQSVGSGPVTSLAASKQLGGVVLHSPLLSGIKVVDPNPDKFCRPSCVWSCFDFYPNDRRVKVIACPVFIMHGQRDDIIPFYHGFRLHKAIKKESRWPAYFPARAGHNDLVETDMRAYFGEISSFLHDVKKIASGQKVSPPVHEKPQQVQMVLKSPSPAKAPEEGEEGKQAFPDSQGDFIGSAQEPKAGPEDGRYEELRKGNIQVPGGLNGLETLAPGAKKARDLATTTT
eukprot:CAMPEP_0197624428 /NCGR_PEP_ID=MMETSP1338-20131121/4070_1 /TAXON_ID=43686 ORGANISM="Pelagodinium beii, Strain RCC1491" /NCGR_SAMPLE_ID=MMETSP1338 /ASSEMBLY_ACC=CAM_ASM_000754 /LENGTH=360 /DNA_ID=CAMNT_0043194565 /DNA_START=236 /DNA_END=1318 /DNA_ORIENTATION=+